MLEFLSFFLKGEKQPDWQKSLYYHFYEYPAEHAVRRHCGCGTDRYKLIRFYERGAVGNCGWEDPMEMNNVYMVNPERRDLTKQLKASGRLLRLQEQYDDPNPSL